MKLIKQLRSIPLLNKPPELESLNLDLLRQKVSDGFFEMLLSTYQEREIDSTNSSLSLQDSEAIVSKYTNANMVIAGAAAIVPGPLGIFSAIPELMLSVGNQMRMVYDLGCTYISPELETILSLEKIKLLINLLEADHEISENEIQFITPIINNADIPFAQKESFLREASQLNSNIPVNMDLLIQQGQNWKDLLFYDLVIMGKRNGDIKPVEQEAILRLAGQINYDVELVRELI